MSRWLTLLFIAGLSATLATTVSADAPTAGERVVVYTPANWPAALSGDLIVPDGAPPTGGWPAAVVLHGGAWHKGDRGHSRGMARRLADAGFVALAVDYRLVPEAIYPAQVLDVQQAIRWLRDNAATLAINPARLALWGSSAGAHLAALTASLSPGDRLFDPQARVQAVVGGGTPTDFRDGGGGNRSLASFLGERWHTGSTVFIEASPIAHATSDDPPVFLFHGDADRTVPVSQATAYRDALTAAGVANALVQIAGAGHKLGPDGKPAIEQGIAFLKQRLASSPAAESRSPTAP